MADWDGGNLKLVFSSPGLLQGGSYLEMLCTVLLNTTMQNILNTKNPLRKCAHRQL